MKRKTPKAPKKKSNHPDGRKNGTSDRSPDWEPNFIECVYRREMITAMRIFEDRSGQLAVPSNTSTFDASEFIDCCARLLDRSKKHLPLVQMLLQTFNAANQPGQVSLLAWTHLKMAEAIVAFHQEELPRAIELTKLTVTLADAIPFDDLQAIGRYYLARAMYRHGEFYNALEVIRGANKWVPESRPVAGGLIKMVAAWLLFSEFGVQEAEAELRSAREVLWGRDYLEDANILSLEGRFARQKGDFQTAVQKAKQAIELFENNNDEEHPNCARCYVHAAFALLLLAEVRGLQPESDDLRPLQTEAFEMLGTAETICRKGGHSRVLDRVHYFRARWWLKLGKLDPAWREAKRAHEIAESAHDYVVMAHALITKCQCARLRNDRTGAKGSAEEARIAAEKTDNRRVKARTWIWLGFTESDPPLGNHTLAAKRREEAAKLLKPSDQDYLRWEFDQLGEQIAKGQKEGQNEELNLPRTVDDVLAIGNLDNLLDDVTKKVIRAVHKRVGTILQTANQLGTVPQRIRRKCPELKH